MSAKNSQPPTIKVVFAGCAGVGKTALLTRLRTGEFQKDYAPTFVPARYAVRVKTARGVVALDVWDVPCGAVGCADDDPAYGGADVLVAFHGAAGAPGHAADKAAAERVLALHPEAGSRFRCATKTDLGDDGDPGAVHVSTRLCFGLDLLVEEVVRRGLGLAFGRVTLDNIRCEKA